MRKVWVWLLFGLVPAAVVAGAVLLLGIAVMPPRFVARAAFVVDWNAMPSVPNDENADKVRKLWRDSIIAEVTSLPKTDQALNDFLDRNGDPGATPGNRASVISKFHRWLHVSLSTDGQEVDKFSFEMRDNDSRWAEATLAVLVQDEVSRVRAQAASGSGLAALRSTANIQEIEQKKSELRRQLSDLESTHSPPFDNDVERQYEAIKEELQKLEGDHALAGVGLLGNVVGIVSQDSVKQVEPTHVERVRAAYVVLVLFAAVALGGIVGAGNLLTRHFVLAARTARAGTFRQPPALGQTKTSKPPPLPHSPPPLPGEDHHATPPPSPGLQPPVIRENQHKLPPPLAR